MPSVIVFDRQGASKVIVAAEGATLMETIRDNGFDELEAMCGGACACATCHVYIGDAWLDRLPAMTEAENGLLECLDERTAASRLSCQITLSNDLDQIQARIAPQSDGY